MDHTSDKRGSKFFLIALVIVILYLSAFQFDLKKAYQYTIQQNIDTFHNFSW